MKNNKGFSLVELIIVIAIMAVLIGVLAPQYLKYVEKSRVSTDKTTIASVKEAILTSLADEDVYESIGTSGSISISNGSTFGSDTLSAAVANICGSKVEFGSKTYKGATVTFNYSYTPSTAKWTVTESYSGVLS